MKKIISTIPLIMTFSLTVVSLTVQAANKVVIIGVDGMGGHYISQTPTPTLDNMASEGAHTLSMQNVLPVISGPNWTAMISGSYPSKNKVTSNIDLYKNQVETLFSAYREQYPQGEMWTLYEWQGFQSLLNASDAFQINEHVAEATAIPQTIALMQNQTCLPDLLFLHLDYVDHAGHSEGWGSLPYLNAIKQADSQIGDLLDAIDHCDDTDKVTVMVISDHGGFKETHQSWDNAVSRSIPFYITGPNIKSQYEITDTVRIWDLSAMVATILNVTIPHSWVSQPIHSVFEDENHQASETILPSNLSQYSTTNTYTQVYHSTGTGVKNDVSIWTPDMNNQQGYTINQIAVEGLQAPSMNSVIFIEDNPEILAKPVGYEFISYDKLSGGTQDAVYWRPIAPSGFTCISDIVTIGYEGYGLKPYDIPEPNLASFRCINSALLAKGLFHRVWTDKGSGAKMDVSVWNGINNLFAIPTYAFRARRTSYEFDFGYPLFYDLIPSSQ
ncbi:alkaline phosphatase family protein [Shewanella surugensis]|uniref:Alkaline phosphatase family protein n=1 Tax=Shewanella surugensis TaxID=212020 RepID=A0ABT0LEW8_9GAMM|nr:alkaline phosphatase family protein [Shewanella surugensis]MCL1126251.1 alkaline phosphatase family protein [Shewanella surugensis]